MRTRGPVTRALRVIFGSPSDEAAHQKQRRIEADFFRLATLHRFHGRTDAIIDYQTRLLALLDEGPVPTIRTAVRSEGMAGRMQDEASERLLFDLLAGTPAELTQLKRRTRLQIAKLYSVLQAIERREASR